MTRVSSKRRRHGFTLVEVLIVIVAMAILAGIVVPKVGESIDDANQSAMLADLHRLTTAIERYKIDHDGLAPDDLGGNSLPQLTGSTDLDGNLGSGANYPYGPYLLRPVPPNPLNQSAAVQVTAVAPPANLDQRVGWIYYPPTGQVWAGQKRSGS